MAKTSIKPRKVTPQEAPEQDEGLLLIDDISPPYPPGWKIRLYSMGPVGMVRAVYTKGDRVDTIQKQSLSWWRAKLLAAGVDVLALEVPPLKPEPAPLGASGKPRPRILGDIGAAPAKSTIKPRKVSP